MASIFDMLAIYFINLFSFIMIYLNTKPINSLWDSQIKIYTLFIFFPFFQF